MAPERFGWCDLKNSYINLVLLSGIFRSLYDTTLRWIPRDFTDDKSTLVQVMAWCHQASSHYLNHCWPSSVPPYGITGPQWVKLYEGSCITKLIPHESDVKPMTAHLVFENCIWKSLCHWIISVWQQNLTHWVLDKMCDTLKETLLYFDSNFTYICSWWSYWLIDNTSALVQVMAWRQAIPWTNDDSYGINGP